MESASEFCHGAGGTCKCEVFYPSSENDRICQECWHGCSKHPNTANGAQSDPPPPKVLCIAPSAPKLPPPTSSSVTEFFHSAAAVDPFIHGTQKQPLHMLITAAKAEVLATSRDRTAPPIQHVANKVVIFFLLSFTNIHLSTFIASDIHQQTCNFRN